jgi:rhodanese-related sulfurtransferase
MVESVSPLRAQQMIAKGEVQVVDVRSFAEWERGHVAGARLVSLEDVRSNTAALPSEGVLFVCAGGVRSQTAARAAVDNGVRRVYSLAGGTMSWAKAGLPIALPLDVAV